MTADPAQATPQTLSREDRVLERITSFRKRRPRLLEEVVTLAHGAGGKSSAALVDS
ncbi:MAG: hypE, partial [Jatrophihabitans sp.]|nr:hypE [Jatrophihabitans sp.]